MEKIANQGIRFLVGLVLARLLAPSDFGTIAVLGIFFSITDTFVDSGFGTALIRKLDRTETDFSTVFIFNIIVSFFLCDSVPYSTFGVFILWNAYTHIYFKSTGNLYRVWRAYGRT